jgi:hypothetical protein
MSVHDRTGSLRVERLGPGELIPVFAFLDRDPVLNVYLVALVLRDALAQPRDEFWAAWRGGEIAALLHLGGQSGAVLPLGEDVAALEGLADRAVERREALPRRFQVIGPRPAVRTFVQRFADVGLTPRMSRPQTYMALARDRLPRFARLPQLRPAGREDYALVYDSGARLRAEELEEDPRDVDPGQYARRVEDECRDGYTYLWVEDGGLNFRASVSARTADAAQVSGVYTPADRRNRGLARRALAELCARLFEQSLHACLFVNDFNAPAIALYRRLGFEVRAEWGSAFFDGVRRPPG